MPLTKIVWSEHESSNIQATFYHEPTQTIVVRFNSGGLYSYMGVDQEIYMNLTHAASMGGYLHDVIKAFPYAHWESEEALIAYLNV